MREEGGEAGAEAAPPPAGLDPADAAAYRTYGGRIWAALERVHAALADAGLVIRTAENGISLVPSPTSIIWSPGVGFAKEQVSGMGRRRM